MTKEFSHLRIKGHYGHPARVAEAQPTGRWMLDGNDELLIECTYSSRRIIGGSKTKRRTLIQRLLRRPAEESAMQYDIIKNTEFISWRNITICYKPRIFECGIGEVVSENYNSV